MEDRVQEFTVSSATVELAALALGVDGARIAKTLSFKTENGCMLILAAGDARIDNHKFKDKFHFKAKTLVTVHIPDAPIETGRKKFGAILGDNVEVGCNSVLNPGTVVGRCSNIYPVSCVRGVVPANSIYKAKDNIVAKK